MPDRSSFWPPVPDWATARLEASGVQVTIARPASMRLVSGAVDPLPAEFGAGRASGPRDLVDPAHYALRLAPDRVVVVSDKLFDRTSGWREDGLAVSDVVDGHVCIDVTGENALELLAFGTDYDFSGPPGAPLESTQMLLAGLRVAVARFDHGWRLHIERPWAPALWRWLETCVNTLEAGAQPANESTKDH